MKYLPSKKYHAKSNLTSFEEYKKLYQFSIDEPEKFWAEAARKHLTWDKDFTDTFCFTPENIKSGGKYLSFFEDGKLNPSFNCLDRQDPQKTALIWVSDNGKEEKRITYGELLADVCQFSQVLLDAGIEERDRVTIYLPMIPQVVIAVLACARVGATHSVVFSAFSSDALKSRINDCESKLVITADFGFHGGKKIELREKVIEAIEHTPTIKGVITYFRGEAKVSSDFNEINWDAKAKSKSPTFTPVSLDSEHPLFLLYTSGSTGKPKGVVHSTAGYLLYAKMTTEVIFDLQPDDIFWCTADVGWITGHSYVIYGPLSNGATVVLYEGIPTFPHGGRFWEIIDQLKVTIFYTAPTAIRALMKLGDQIPKSYDLSSLRLLGSVGEPINPAAWIWYYETIGKSNCPVIDTWWQTETGGIMITTIPGAMEMKPGSAGLPFYGIVPKIVDANEGSGNLIIDKPWPSMTRGVYGDDKNELVHKTYFAQYPEKFLTGDGAKEDKDGYFWLLGRVDDVLNVSAHRFSTAEFESSFVKHPAVAEAAVVGFPHDIKGQGIHCYITLKDTFLPSEELNKELIAHIRKEIGPIATPDKIQFCPALPKTRSGKIMRRILRKIAEGEKEEFGDISTLADPAVVKSLVLGRV